MISKLSWSLFSSPHQLWERVITGKYNLGDEGWPEALVAQSGSSATWQGITRGYNEVICNEIKWNVANGYMTLFGRTIGC